MVSIPPESNSNPSNPTSISTPLFDTNLNIPIAIYKGVRSCAKHPLANFVSYHRIVETYKAFTSYINQESIPKNGEEAFADPNQKEAINEEMDALKKNETGDIVDLFQGTWPVGCKWVFLIKYKVDGSVERYKA